MAAGPGCQADATGLTRLHQDRPGAARHGGVRLNTKRSLARVIATYRPLTSSRSRAACSSASRAPSDGGQRDSDAMNATRCGRAACTGQSTSSVAVSLACASGSASITNTARASSPLAPWMVSSCTASLRAAGTTLTLRRRSARTKLYGVA